MNLRRELKPFLRAMGVFGMYHTPKRWLEETPTWKTRLHYLHKCYCLAMQFLLWFNVIRTLTAIWITDNLADPLSISARLTTASWLLVCSISGSVWFYICCTDKLPKMVQFWQEFCQSSDDSTTLGISLDASWIRRRVQVLLCFCIIFTACNVSIMTASIYGNNGSSIYYDPFRNTGLTIQVPLLILTAVVDTAAFLLPIMIFIIFCMIFDRQFKMLTKTFASCLTEKGEVNKDVILFRRQHLYLSKLLFLADDVFSFYLACSASIYLFFICFQLFQLVIAKTPLPIPASLVWGWLLVVSVVFGLITVCAAQVHDKVWAVIDRI